jgi:hypothetical protein
LLNASAPPPYAASAPWDRHAQRSFVAAQPTSLLSSMYFNTPSAYRLYVADFAGVLRGWVKAADRAGISTDVGMMSFLRRELNQYFNATRDALAGLYPGQSAHTYRLLMTMNLAHGYFPYATTYGSGRSFYQTLQLRTGDCSEIADLLQGLLRCQGIAAPELVQVYNYKTPLGRFVASHVVVYTGGMWLDAEINTAFRLQLHQLTKVPPSQRLSSLLKGDDVFGFYDLYLKPQVRLSELRHGVDGGIIAFYYQYYFAGIGQGNTSLQLN